MSSITPRPAVTAGLSTISSPAFLLGLTGTPNRMDGADLLALCSDNLVYECPLTEGIERAN